METTNWRDVFERAVWTFVQGAVAVVTAVPLITDIEGWAALGVAAVSGGVAAVLSFLKTFAQERLALPDTRV